MPAPALEDIERLLQPISADAPAGGSLRHDGINDKIREARREDDASIPQGVWERPLKVAEWGSVITLCTEVLERRSKDLQVAAWVAEAWTIVFGVPGAMRGLELVSGLLARYWEGLYPALDDGDDEPRVRVLDWLDGALARRLRSAKLGDERTEIAFGDWERARVSGDPEEGPTREGLLARMSMVGAPRWAAF